MRLRKDTNEINNQEVELIASVSDALAHPARVKIFQFIMSNNGETKPVCNRDVFLNFDYAQATISQHIKKLIDSGLIETKKVDKHSYYFANVGKLIMYLDATKKFSIVKGGKNG